MWWLATMAWAEEVRFNREPLFRAGIVWHPGAEAPFGAEVGVGMLLSLGDHCSWSERDCRSSTLWPLAGPVASVDWRGGDRFGAALGALAGGGQVEMYQFGFFPITVAFGSVGVRYAVGAGVEFAFGGELQRALVVHQRLSETESRTWGMPFTQLTLRGGTTWGAEGWGGPRLGLGLQGTLFAFDYS